jgi:hypothetical protein
LQVQAAGLALGSYAKKAAVMTFMGNTLAETLLSRSKASLTILNGIQEIFLVYQSKHVGLFVPQSLTAQQIPCQPRL